MQEKTTLFNVSIKKDQVGNSINQIFMLNLAILRNRELSLLWLAYAISTFGDFFTYVAFLILLQTRMGSASAIAGLIISQTIAVLLLGPFAGTWVDKYNRKHIMILSDILRAILVASIPFIQHLYQFYIVGFLLTAATVPFASARSAVLPNFVEKDLLLKVNSIFALTDNILRIGGPAIAGFLIAYQGLTIPFWIDAATFLISALLLSMLRISYSSRSAERQNTFWRLFKEGFLYIARATSARTLLFTRIIVALGAGIIQVVLVIFIKETRGWSDQYFGLALSTIAVGSFVSSLWLSWRGQRYQPTRLFSLGTLVVGLSFVSLALSPFFALSLLVLLLNGLADSCVVVSFSALAQRDIPNGTRGRFFSTSITLFRAAVLVSALIGSLLSDSIGTQSTLIVAGLIVALGGVFAFFSLPSRSEGNS